MARYRNGQPSGRGGSGSSILTRKQSGDDWGMEDMDDYFGTDISNMDPDSPEFAAAMAAQMGSEYQQLPGEVDNQGFSSDFTDSGIQTLTDPEDKAEDMFGPHEEEAKTKKIGGVGQVGGRVGPQGRRQMVTGSRKASILDPNPYG